MRWSNFISKVNGTPCFIGFRFQQYLEKFFLNFLDILLSMTDWNFNDIPAVLYVLLTCVIDCSCNFQSTIEGLKVISTRQHARADVYLSNRFQYRPVSFSLLCHRCDCHELCFKSKTEILDIKIFQFCTDQNIGFWQL